ncbi:selenoprotein S B-like [Cloeon dipterum]|uniref:selenoprotein S B-like n=1 Tax=Cloeon dipterum TaxID=197152 RepID=UPI0032205710
MGSQGEESVHPEVLQQEEPEIVTTILDGVASIMQIYGWYIFVGIAVGILAWHKWLRQKYWNWQREKDEREYAAKYHKNPDIGVGRFREEAMLTARRKQQEELARASALYAEQEKERQEELERLKLENNLQRNLGINPGRRLGNTLDSNADEVMANAELMKKGRAFKKEYNPLDGGSGGAGYRAPKKGCPGGGCGRK